MVPINFGNLKLLLAFEAHLKIQIFEIHPLEYFNQEWWVNPFSFFISLGMMKG